MGFAESVCYAISVVVKENVVFSTCFPTLSVNRWLSFWYESCEIRMFSNILRNLYAFMVALGNPLHTTVGAETIGFHVFAVNRQLCFWSKPRALGLLYGLWWIMGCLVPKSLHTGAETIFLHTFTVMLALLLIQASCSRLAICFLVVNGVSHTRKPALRITYHRTCKYVN